VRPNFANEPGLNLGASPPKLLSRFTPLPESAVCPRCDSFRSRWDAQQWRADDPQASPSIASKTQPEYELTVTTVLLGKRMAFLAMLGNATGDDDFIVGNRQCRIVECIVSHCLYWDQKIGASCWNNGGRTPLWFFQKIN